MQNIFYYENTFVGTIAISSNGQAVTGVRFNPGNLPGHTLKEDEIIKRAYQELNEYFSGQRKKFNVPLNPLGTKFQQKVWKALQEIPCGETQSYKQVAEAVGNVKACRAVGMANNKNPIAIFIPCHRVVGSSGKLVGYAGGLDIKQKLLSLEQVG